MSGIAAPLARRRPISRVRWVTVCHTTPVRPSATMSSRNAGDDPARDERRQRVAQPLGAHLDGRFDLERPVLRHACMRLTSRSSKAAVVPGCTLIARRPSAGPDSMPSGRARIDHVVLGAEPARRPGGTPGRRRPPCRSLWRPACAPARSCGNVRPIGSAAPKIARGQLLVDHHRVPARRVVLAAEPPPLRRAESPSTAAKPSVTPFIV